MVSMMSRTNSRRSNAINTSMRNAMSGSISNMSNIGSNIGSNMSTFNAPPANINAKRPGTWIFRCIKSLSTPQIKELLLLYRGHATEPQMRVIIGTLTGLNPTANERAKLLDIAAILYSGQPLRSLYSSVWALHIDTQQMSARRRPPARRRVEKALKAIHARIA